MAISKFDRLCELIETHNNLMQDQADSLGLIQQDIRYILGRLNWMEGFVAAKTGPIKNYFYHNREQLENAISRFHRSQEEE